MAIFQQPDSVGLQTTCPEGGQPSGFLLPFHPWVQSYHFSRILEHHQGM
jgi:hypothetical protein